MKAVYKRELSAYFSSPIGYIYLAVMLALCGYFFSISALAGNTTDIRPVFNGIFNLSLFLIPILSMRLLSEERRQKTDQALICAPVSLWAVIAGKFLSAVTVYMCGVSITLFYGAAMQYFSNVNWAHLFGCLLGTALLGSALIAIGLFISSLTENQVVAAAATFAAMLLISQVANLSLIFKSAFAATVITKLSFLAWYRPFTLGYLALDGIVFYLTVISLFLFFTVRVFEKRRYA